MPSEKGKDSVANGIQLVQAQKISVTKRRNNIIKEYRNYLWQVDKDGKVLNKPEHTFSNSMDGGRYGTRYILKGISPEIDQFSSNLHTRRENSTK